MSALYDDTYIETTLICLKTDLEDLKHWSAHNGDKLLDEIEKLQTAITALEKTYKQ